MLPMLLQSVIRLWGTLAMNAQTASGKFVNIVFRNRTERKYFLTVILSNITTQISAPMDLNHWGIVKK